MENLFLTSCRSLRTTTANTLYVTALLRTILKKSCKRESDRIVSLL